MSEDSAGASAAPPEDYPPARHVLRDLGIWVESGEGPGRAGLPVHPALSAGTGGVRAGVLATLVDVVAGGFAIEAVAPDWVATSDLVLHRLAPTISGELVAEPRLVRSGRRTVVLEVRVHAGEHDVGLATVGFSRLEARGTFQRSPRVGLTRTEFASADSGLDGPLDDALGIRAAEAGIEIDVTPYVGNSLGAVQGGVVALLLDAAAEHAAGAALGAPVACTGLAIHFVGLGKRGPLRAEARVLRVQAPEALVRVELRDAGAEDRVCALATATVRAGCAA